MEKSEKGKILVRIGITLQKILQSEKESTAEGHKTLPSIRKLAAASGIEYSLLQKISSGKKNPELTTLVGIAAAFGMTMEQFFAVFDNIDESVMPDIVKKPGSKKKKNRKK